MKTLGSPFSTRTLPLTLNEGRNAPILGAPMPKPRFTPLVAAAVTIFLALASTAVHAADEPSLDANAGGQALATRLRSLRPPENSEVTGFLLIKRRGRPPLERVPIVCRVMVRADGWDSSYETAATAAIGSQKLVIKHFTNAPSAYLYAAAPSGGPAVPDLKPLSRDNLDTPLAASDFWCDELGLEFLFWPGQTSLKGEMRLGQPCYVLESRDASGRRIKSWIDKESVDQGAPGLLIAESYNPKDELIKEFDLGGGSFKKVNGRWQLQQMKIRSVRQGSETVLKFNLEESKKTP